MSRSSSAQLKLDFLEAGFGLGGVLSTASGWSFMPESSGFSSGDGSLAGAVWGLRGCWSSPTPRTQHESVSATIKRCILREYQCIQCMEEHSHTEHLLRYSNTH